MQEIKLIASQPHLKMSLKILVGPLGCHQVRKEASGPTHETFILPKPTYQLPYIFSTGFGCGSLEGRGTSLVKTALGRRRQATCLGQEEGLLAFHLLPGDLVGHPVANPSECGQTDSTWFANYNIDIPPWRRQLYMLISNR